MFRTERRGRQKGQVLVIAAMVIPVVALLFLFALGLAAVQDIRAHAVYALGVATRGGARQVGYACYGQGEACFAQQDVAVWTQTVFAEALALRPAGLVRPVEEIADDVVVLVGYGTPDNPWVSPITLQEHPYPTVAAHVPVPVRVWMFELNLRIVAETEVR